MATPSHHWYKNLGWGDKNSGAGGDEKLIISLGA